MDEKGFFENLYSAALTMKEVFTERELIKTVDQCCDPGYVNNMLKVLRMSLAQCLLKSGHFEKRGRDVWSTIVTESMRNVADSIADRSNIRKKRSRNRNGGRGGAVHAGRGVGRGGGTARRGGFGGHGNNAPRGGTRACARVTPPQSSNFPDYFNQHPLQPQQSSSTSSNSNRNYDDNYHDPDSNYHFRPQSPQNHYQSSSRGTNSQPRQSSPIRFSTGNGPSYPDDYYQFTDSEEEVRVNGGISGVKNAIGEHHGYDNGVEPNFYNVERRNQGGPGRYVSSSNNSETGNQAFSGTIRGRSSPPLSNRTSDHHLINDRKPACSSDCQYSKYGYHGQACIQLEALPQKQRQPPPQSQTNKRCDESSRPVGNQSDLYSNLPRHSDADSSPHSLVLKRYESPQANQFSEKYRPESFPSSPQQSSGYLEQTSIQQETLPQKRRQSPPPEQVNNRQGPDYRIANPNFTRPIQAARRPDPLLEKRLESLRANLQPKQDCKAPETSVHSSSDTSPIIGYLNQISISPEQKHAVQQPLLKEPSTSSDQAVNGQPKQNSKKHERLQNEIKKFLLDMKTGSEQTIPVKLLVDFLSLKKLYLPGKDLNEMTAYLVELKDRQPDVLEHFDVDAETSSLQLIHDKLFGNWDFSREDVFQSRIYEMVSEIKEYRFKLSEVTRKAIKIAGTIPQQKVKWYVTYVIFHRFNEGDFIYDQTDVTHNTILNTSRSVVKDSESNMWTMPFEPTELKKRQDMVEVKICYFRNLNRFSVQLSETVPIFEEIEKKLNRLNTSQDEQPYGGWKVGHACIVRIEIEEHTTWTRGCIRHIESSERGIFRIYCMDYGFWMCAKSSAIKFMPKRYLDAPPCAVQCTLDATDDDVLLFEGPSSTASWSRQSKKCFASLKDVEKKFDVPVFTVNLHLEDGNHQKVDIQDVVFI